MSFETSGSFETGVVKVRILVLKLSTNSENHAWREFIHLLNNPYLCENIHINSGKITIFNLLHWIGGLSSFENSANHGSIRNRSIYWPSPYFFINSGEIKVWVFMNWIAGLPLDENSENHGLRRNRPISWSKPYFLATSCENQLSQKNSKKLIDFLSSHTHTLSCVCVNSNFYRILILKV